TAVRVWGVGAGGDHQGAAVTGVVRVPQDSGDVGVPVPDPSQHGQFEGVGRELSLMGSFDRMVLDVVLAYASVGLVVLYHLFEALVGDAAAAGDVPQERQDVILALGASEGGKQNGIVVGGGRNPVAHRRTSATSAASMRRPV